MATCLDLLFLLGAGGVLFLSTWIVLAFLRVRGGVQTVLSGFVLAAAQVFAIIHVLSIFSAISARNVATAEVLILVVVWLLRRPLRNRLPLPPLNPARWLSAFWRQMPPGVYSWLLSGALLLIVLVTLVTALAVPQNIPDCLGYHLTRCAYWHQTGTLAHCNTDSHRQNEMPVVAEVGVLWLMLFAPGDRYVGPIQWLALWLCAVGLYGILTRTGPRRGVVPLTVCLFVSLPGVIIQASTVQNDLLTAALLITGLYLGLCGLDRDHPAWSLLIVSAVSIGLMMATKGYALLFAPGIALAAWWACRAVPLAQRARRCLLYGLCCAGSIAVFCGPNWLRNSHSYGNMFLSPTTGRMLRLEEPGPRALLSTATKSLAGFVELGSWADAVGLAPPLDAAIDASVRTIHGWLGLEVSWTNALARRKAVITVGARRQWVAYYGGLGWLLVLPCGVGALICTGVQRLRREPIGGQLRIAAVFALVGWIFFLLNCGLIKWMTTDGRLMCAFVLCLMPAAACVIQLLLRVSLPFRLLAAGCLVLIGSASAWDALFWNPRAPLIPRAGRCMLSASRSEMRYWGLRPQDAASYREITTLVKKHIPPTGRLGFALDYRQKAFAFFGERLERTCIPIRIADLRAQGVETFMAAGRLDGALIQLRSPDGRKTRLWPTQELLELLEELQRDSRFTMLSAPRYALVYWPLTERVSPEAG